MKVQVENATTISQQKWHISREIDLDENLAVLTISAFSIQIFKGQEKIITGENLISAIHYGIFFPGNSRYPLRCFVHSTTIGRAVDMLLESRCKGVGEPETGKKKSHSSMEETRMETAARKTKYNSGTLSRRTILTPTDFAVKIKPAVSIALIFRTKLLSEIN